MENYIVRIYRRDQHRSDEIAGLVELVEAEKKQAFKNMDELSHILCSSEKKKRPKRKKASQKK
ncbi:MAG: hypothetical protein OQJ93_14115 [Ignavibacteriaceae bacterium]|nr:hypothetical protein [Ignavibacteriaceae bacterium]